MNMEDSQERKTRLKERWIRWKRAIRLLYLRILRLKGQPREVAGGVAIGVFIGMTPTVPLHTVLAVLTALLLGKSKLAAALGVWISNPLFLPFVYLLDYEVGRIITGTNPPSLMVSGFSIHSLIELGWDIFYPLFIGGLVMGLVLAIPSYFITKRIITLYRERRRRWSDRVGFPSKTT